MSLASQHEATGVEACVRWPGDMGQHLLRFDVQIALTCPLGFNRCGVHVSVLHQAQILAKTTLASCVAGASPRSGLNAGHQARPEAEAG
jgi:hypothetical protein